MTARMILILSILLSCPAILAAHALDTTKIDEALGRSGQTTGDVYRVGFPRTDLHVVIAGVEIKPGLALGSWAAFNGKDKDAAVERKLYVVPSYQPRAYRRLQLTHQEEKAVISVTDEALCPEILTSLSGNILAQP